MTLEQARYQLTRLTRKRKALMAFNALLWSLGAFAVAASGVSIFTDSLGLRVATPCLIAMIVFISRVIQLGVFKFNEASLVNQINNRYDQYQQSADLLLSTRELTTLQQIQQIRTLNEFNRTYQNITFPLKLGHAFLVLIVGLFLSALITYLPPLRMSVYNIVTPSSEKPLNPEKTVLPPSIKNISIQITPPQYTGLKKSITEKLNTVVAEGSIIKWTIVYSNPVKSARILFTSTDSLALTQENQSYTGQRTCTENLIYRFAWTDAAGNYSTSDYFNLEVKADQPPSVSVANLSQFNELSLNEQSRIDLKSTISDDYNVGRAHIIATVSKGSGESVKFREEKLLFSSPEKIIGKSVHAERIIDLKKLGMEPGDELYFYVEAWDTKTPHPNRARTETYFISLRDTASQDISADAGLGVDLMPDYFRSQRQIIIDTEKLLRNRKKITVKEFKRTSNELGYDQKVLRLKYGEFLGEEFESGIGPASGAQGEAAETIEDALKQYGHAHDTENEHNLVDDKKAKPAEEHHHKQGEDGKEESPLEAFAHNHDNAEESTFFILSIRAKLKAALTVMWDAELHLRLFEPEKSLPFQYQALRLLKEISNDSRVYVHRTGFDPPPIKEDSRLKGDLSETKSTTNSYARDQQEEFPFIRKSLPLIEKMIETNEPLSASSTDVLQQAGNELSAVALKKPGAYLKTLSQLQEFLQKKTPDNKQKEVLTQLRKTFWTIIPPQPTSPARDRQTLHELDEQFIDNLDYD